MARSLKGTARPVINQYFGTESYDNGDNSLDHVSDSSSIEGYFDFPATSIPANGWPNSNEREMIYIISFMLDFGIDGVLQTPAHEFTHLVQWNTTGITRLSNVWFTEGIAMYANYLLGKVTEKTNYWDFSTIRCIPGGSMTLLAY